MSTRFLQTAMTTTSSLFQPSMEIPAGEDLEMASPYHGQGDDFDIDIDLMEDHASNMDSDMMGADDFPNTSQPLLFQNDATDDADMVDEPSEGSMVDVENLVDEDQDIDVEYDDVTYEAEMLEDEEPVDAPVPEIHVESTTIPTATTAEPQITESGKSVPETATEATQETQTEETPLVSSTFEQNELDTSGHEQASEQPPLLENASAEQPKIEQPENDQNAPVGADHSQSQVEGKQTNEAKNTDENAPDEQQASDPLVETSDKTQASVQNDAENTEQPEIPAAYDTDRQGATDEPLHPIKVMYQENEISLFPPWEGDSAETFFLHDEDVTYERVDKLFSALREVLEDNLAEHDVLVIDIDSLGIQITEDSSCTSKFTLQQILDVYLRLCHNDENHEPDALYLSLSSKPAVYSELAILDSAAKEGKGLSEVHLWGDYDEVDDEVEEAVEEPANADGQPGEEPEHVKDAQGQPSDDQGLHGDEATAQFEESNIEENVATETVQGFAAGEPNVGPHLNVPEQATVHEESEHHEDPINNSQAAEGPGSESINTPAPNTESTNTALPEHSSADVTQGDENDYSNHDDQEQDLEDYGDDPSEADKLEVADLTASGGEYDDQDYENEVHAENTTSYDEISGVDLEATEQDVPNLSDGEDSPGANFDPDVYEESESTVENAPGNDHSHEQNLDLEDDLLEISEDVFQDPSVDNQHNEPHDPESVTQQKPARKYAGSPFADDIDDDDYDFDPELDVTEGTELGELDTPGTDSHAHDTLSTKRSREEEDEWDVTEATTPELKRQRSS